MHFINDLLLIFVGKTFCIIFTNSCTGGLKAENPFARPGTVGLTPIMICDWWERACCVKEHPSPKEQQLEVTGQQERRAIWLQGSRKGAWTLVKRMNVLIMETYVWKLFYLLNIFFLFEHTIFSFPFYHFLGETMLMFFTTIQSISKYPGI